MVTRKEVAIHAGVSEATVSHVVNNTKYVSPDLMKKVQEAITVLDYKPNLIARSLMTKSSNHVGILVSDIKNPYYGEITEGMQEVASQEGYIVSLFCISNVNDKNEALLNIIQRQLDGIFIATITAQNDDVSKRLKEHEIPGVDVEIRYSNSILNMVKYLRQMGHERIGMLCGLPLKDSGDSRFEDFKSALEREGLGLYPELLIDGAYPYETTRATGYDAMMKLLESKTRVTAVFALNDLMAIGAMQAIREMGLKIPEDISVVGCDDIFLSQCTDPPLTTIRIPKKELGMEAMYALLRRIREKKAEKLVINTEFIIRSSTGPAKKTEII